ncbi:Uncharacterised protein [Halioglobus japonicus]|nr:Uncharacterised protein [Halioglobus japonicus]
MTNRYMTVIVLAFGLVLGSCSSSNDSDKGTTPPDIDDLEIMLLSPSGPTSIDAGKITMEIANSGFVNLIARNLSAPAASEDITREGVDNGDSFFVFDMPLFEGSNSIEIEATAPNNRSASQTVMISSNDPALEVVKLRPTPEMGTAPHRAQLTVAIDPAISADDILVDMDGDGVIDETSGPNNPIMATYKDEGSFTPKVTVRTDSNLLISSEEMSTRAVRVLPPVVRNAAASITTTQAVNDVQVLSDGTIYLLQSNRILILDSDGTLSREISHSATDPQGMFVDESGNIFIADTLSSRVIKLLASRNFSPDTLLGPEGAFGEAGSENGELNAPEDVAVVTITGEDIIYVVDTGNSRIQRFNRVGVFEEVITTEANGTLKEPSGIAVTDEGTLFIVDRGANQVVVLDNSGNFDGVIGGPGTLPGQFRSPNKVSLSPDGLIVTDTGNRRVQIIQLNGVVLRVVDLPGDAPGVAGVRPDVSPAELLLVADQLDPSELTAFDLVQDPPEDGPLAIARKFTAAVAAENFPAARVLLQPATQVLFDQGIADFGDQLSAAASNTKRLSLLSASVSSAIVSGESGENAVEISLVRDQSTGMWMIQRF